jgi:hypothetical protein
MDLQVACRAHGNDLRMGKETGAQGTCECTATPVIASRSNEGGAVCDPTTSAPSQRRRTARTHRRRILCTTEWKPFHWRCEHIAKQKVIEPRLHSSTLLAATYGSLRDILRPAHDGQRSARMLRGASQGSLWQVPQWVSQRKRQKPTAPLDTVCRPPRSHTSRSGGTAQSCEATLHVRCCSSLLSYARKRHRLVSVP